MTVVLRGHVNKKFDSSERLPKHDFDLQIGLQLLLNRHHLATRWVSGQIQLKVGEGHELAAMTVVLRAKEGLEGHELAALTPDLRVFWVFSLQISFHQGSHFIA
ncbi:hypothetical protein N7454_008963 [Penicillium verhagenii]|nr:hypothetical protein N7454_008963 [Penicillium verhagenii]